MIAAAKRIIPAKPIHLFGAGHPLTIPLAVALGCDMFDSASYMLYAKDGRYMTPSGTVRLDELTYLPCQCPVCSTHTAAELRGTEKDDRVIEIAKHNLHVLKAEVDAVKQAIVDGRLWEYVMQKARAHPKLMEAARLFAGLDQLEAGTPLFKEKAIYFYDPVDQYRPEARRYRRMTSQFKSSRKKLVLCQEGQINPFYSTRDFREIIKSFPDAQICSYNPFLGIIPAEISDIFPASHNIVSRESRKLEDYPTFTESLQSFVAANGFTEIIVAEGNSFIEEAIKASRLTAIIAGRND